jgi:hypothetical protein
MPRGGMSNPMSVYRGFEIPVEALAKKPRMAGLLHLAERASDEFTT